MHQVYIPNSYGNDKSLVFIWAWSSIFISETVVMQISQLFMFQATHTWFIVAQVMSFGEWLSIIARSELGSDLDCSVINARSELGSDLDCYELTIQWFVFFQDERDASADRFRRLWIRLIRTIAYIRNQYHTETIFYFFRSLAWYSYIIHWLECYG